MRTLFIVLLLVGAMAGVYQLATSSYEASSVVTHVHVGRVEEVDYLTCDRGCCLRGSVVTFADGESVRFNSGHVIPKRWVKIHCTESGNIRGIERLTEEEGMKLSSNGGHVKLEISEDEVR